MDPIDSKILVITKNKNKIKPIRRILSDKTNFELVQDETDGEYYRVNSLSSEKTYKVFKTGLNYFCNCIYNERYIPYREGMKRYGKKNHCVHVLALRTYLAITKA